jgi:hypothetical protein
MRPSVVRQNTAREVLDPAARHDIRRKYACEITDSCVRVGRFIIRCDDRHPAMLPFGVYRVDQRHEVARFLAARDAIDYARLADARVLPPILLPPLGHEGFYGKPCANCGEPIPRSNRAGHPPSLCVNCR